MLYVAQWTRMGIACLFVLLHICDFGCKLRNPLFESQEALWVCRHPKEGLAYTATLIMLQA